VVSGWLEAKSRQVFVADGDDERILPFNVLRVSHILSTELND